MTARFTIVFTFLFVLAGFWNAGLKAIGKDGDRADNGGDGTADGDHGKSASPIISSLTSYNQYTYATHAVKVMATGDEGSEGFATLRAPEEMNLSVSANVGAEAVGTVITVTATAANAVSGDQTLDIEVSGTGIIGTDYTLSNTIITILDGQTTGTVTFIIQDDSDIEGTETVMLTISNPSTGITLGATTSQNIAITDNDFPSITYGGTGFDEVSANDGAVTGSITATLAGDAFQNTLAVGTDVALDNIPIGLIPSVTVEKSAQSWTTRSVPEDNFWSSVTYGNGLFVAVARDGTNRVMTSPDGITWTARTAAASNSWISVTYGNGLFVAVNFDGTHRVMTSPDGITWTARTAAENNLWVSVTYGNGLFVGVATLGTNRVMTSPDGITWTARSATEDIFWSSVTYDNGLFVAVAQSGTNRVMTSPDGITWTVRAAAENNRWVSVTHGNGLFVAVAYSGTNRVMTSPDGITWTARVAAEDNSWASVTYGNGLFVAVAFDGTNRVMTSSANDRIVLSLTGNANPHTNADDVADITFDFANSAFTGGNAANIINATGPASSNLGVDFDDPTVNLSVSANSGTEADGTVITATATASGAVSGDQTVDLGVSGAGITGTDYMLSNTTITILDGQTTGTVTFTILDDTDIEGTETATLTISNPSSGLTLGTTTSQDVAIIDNDFPSITYGDTGFNEVVANDGAVTGSITATLTGDTFKNSLVVGTDVTLGNIPAGLTPSLTVEKPGVSWTARTTTASNKWLSVVYGNGLFVAVSRNGTDRVMTSPDGVTWTSRTAAENNEWRSVTYGNGLFVAVASDGTNRVMTSPDGINWTGRTAAANNSWESVTYGNGLFVAVSRSGTNRVMTSPDGVTWTSRTAAENNQWRSVTYGNGLLVAVAGSGTNRVMTSLDGITWTARTAAENNQWNSVTYGHGLFVAVCRSGTNLVMTSPDGINWTGRTAANNWWTSVTYGNGLFVAVSLNRTNRIMTSPDGITWTGRTAAENNSWESVTYGNGLFVAVASDGTNRVITNAAKDGATLMLTGNATHHTNADDVADITFDFANSAFTGGNAANVINATGTASSNLGIDFDDPAAVEVNLSVSANSGKEADGTVITVTAIAASAVTGDQTVDLGVSGTGITSTDYTLSNTTITILDGQTAGTVTFTILNDTDIEGTETATLTISNPSAGLILGSTTSQDITIIDNDLPASATVDATVLLEAAYNGTGMSTRINDHIPLAQPYTNNGHTGGTASTIPVGVVDWVLVELREAASAATATNATKVGSAAGFLMSDGSIKATDGTSDLIIALSGNTGGAFYMVVYHRNHLPIMSASAIAESEGKHTVDFTSSSTATYQNAAALKALTGGRYGMIAGDADADADVDASDLTLWRTHNGRPYDYSTNGTADLNLDGKINAVDRNGYQKRNNNRTSQVPTN